MTNLSKFGKQISAFAIVFAILAVSLFTGSVFVNAAEPVCTAGGAVLFWDGTADSTLADNGETGTPEDPIILDNAQELCYLVNKVSGGTPAGKLCYKMADGISKIVLQPESIANVDADGNGVYDIFELADGAATKAYFESITPINWVTDSGEDWFAGTFDGNGVEFVGMYSVCCSAGLFPTVDGGANFKNFAITNSYIKGVKTSPFPDANGSYKINGNCRTGAIFGGTCSIGYGAKVDGIITVDSVIVANNYVYGERSTSHASLITGSTDKELVQINKAVVYGNLSGYGEAPNNEPLYLYNGYDGATDINKLTNSVILGVNPYPTSYKANVSGLDVIENVYTDANVEPWNDKADYADTDMMSVAGLSIKELADKCGTLLGAYHGTVKLVTTATTHSLQCETCGFVSYGGVAVHTWTEDTHKCTVCELVCTHSDTTVDNNFAGDCVTPKGKMTKCNICGNIESTPAAGATAPGHALKWVPEIEATCKSEGRLGYWHCETCGSNFAGEEDNADAVKLMAMDKSVADPDNYEGFITAIAQHKSTKIQIDGTKGHYWLCDTCGGRILAVQSKKTVEEGRVKRHNWKDGACADCGLKCPSHNYQSNGNIVSAGSCTEGRVEELECTICGDTKTTTTATSHEIVKVEEVAATDKLEGKKAHYTCTKCKALFADAEGKVTTDVLSLVIAKILPEEYQNTTNSNSGTSSSTNTTLDVNVDTSKTSPKTSDNLTSVFAVAALAGAGFVITNKARKVR